MPKMTGSRFIAETLKGYGVTSVFFVPSILKGVLVELEKLGVKRVLCHSEKAAAYMADGYARLSRGPGIAMAQSVGAANLAAGLQDPFLGLSPVIALTGRKPPIERYRHGYQEIDHWPLYAPVTKFNAYIDTVEQLPVILRQAFREATAGKPGPVHLELMGYQGETVAEGAADLEVVIEETFAKFPAFRPAPDADAVQQAARLLTQAQRPVLVAGGGAVASQAGPEILKLAMTLAMPVATSLNGKGIIPEDHPLAVGMVGTYSRWCANQIVSEADLVLFVGSQTGGQVTHFWNIPRPGTPIIQIDVDPTELGRNYPAQVPLLGDARVSLQQILQTLGPVTPKESWAAHAGQLVGQWRRELTSQLRSEATPIRPERLCQELSDFLPDDAVLVSDTGHAGMWSGGMLDLKYPGQSYLRAAGSLGWGFPAALGAKCARPERPVICFTGDGGFWYHLTEMETAVRCGINTITVINNNHSLNQDKAGVDQAYGSQTTGNPEEIWVFRDVDFAKVAESMGCLGIRVERPAEIREALEQAMTAGRPVVIDVVSDIEAFAPLPFVPTS
ncbi:MAG: thiamine pyrophosphate-binding protein [Chloroflexi bacterium]|nr:thiamine pyrophosphate-binding protein [Chloroflexota bacterium]